MNYTIRFCLFLILTVFLAACGGGGASGSGGDGSGGDGSGGDGSGGDGSTAFAIDHTVPADGSATHDRDAPIEIHFTAAVDIGSVQGNLWLFDGDDNEVPFEASLSNDGLVATITPLDRLQRGAQYRLEVEAGLLPQGSGDGLGAASLAFTTSNERKARPAMSLAPNSGCSSLSHLPWVEMLDDGSAYVALPRRKIEGNCTSYHAPELVTVLSEKRAAEPHRPVPLTDAAALVADVLEPRRDPATGNILFLAPEVHENQSLYAIRVVDNATRLIGEKQALSDVTSQYQDCHAYVLPHDDKFHVFYRDDRSCPAGSCDYVRDYSIAPDGAPDGVFTAFTAAKPAGGYACDANPIWTAASTPNYLLVAYDQYVNNRYVHLRGPEFSASSFVSAPYPLWTTQQAHTFIDEQAKLGLLMYILDAGTFRIFTIDMTTGETAIQPGYATGDAERILTPWAEGLVAPVLDTARKKLWVLWVESGFDASAPHIGEAPYRLKLSAFDYELMEWSGSWTIQESKQTYQAASPGRDNRDNADETAVMLGTDGTLLLIHTDYANEMDGGLVLQRFDPVDGSVTPVADLFSVCRGSSGGLGGRILFDAAQNAAGDIAIAIRAQYAQTHCETESVHEDGEFVLVRYD